MNVKLSVQPPMDNWINVDVGLLSSQFLDVCTFRLDATILRSYLRSRSLLWVHFERSHYRWNWKRKDFDKPNVKPEPDVHIAIRSPCMEDKVLRKRSTLRIELRGELYVTQ